ncbi:MAG: cyclase family protein [bacterium]|nr:cyclase family protein [bacterium]
MARRLIDLNVPLRNDSYDGTPPEIQYISHEQIGRRWAKTYGFEPSDLPDGCGGASERLWLSSHSGTHIDTAYHYAPTSEGKPSRPVDEVELDHFFADAFRLDLTHKKPAELIEPEDLQAALAQIGYTIKPGDIALIWTGTTDNYYNSPRFLEMQPGMTRASILWLAGQGVKVVGIDAWGIDIPFSKMAEKLKAGDKAAFWQGHYAGKEKEYFQIEKLANLGNIPRAHGFQVACFPVLIERASGAWCRAVAIVEDEG